MRRERENANQLYGNRTVPLNLKVLTKFGLCSNCLQKLDEWSLARISVKISQLQIPFSVHQLTVVKLSEVMLAYFAANGILIKV